jgi:hypothetical protein
MIRAALAIAGVFIFGAGLAVGSLDPKEGIFYIATACCLWLATLGGTE